MRFFDELGTAFCFLIAGLLAMTTAFYTAKGVAWALLAGFPDPGILLGLVIIGLVLLTFWYVTKWIFKTLFFVTLFAGGGIR